MASITETRLVDDLDGSEADETVKFGLDGKEYEIDLSSDNAANLRDALTAYVTHARKVGRKGRSTPGQSNDSRRIRAWLVDNGYSVADRGRIPEDLQEIYRKGTSS